MSMKKFEVLVGLSEDSLKNKVKAVMDALKAAGVESKHGVAGYNSVAVELASFFEIPEIIILKGEGETVTGILGMKTTEPQPVDLLAGGDWSGFATLSANAEAIKSAVA